MAYDVFAPEGPPNYIYNICSNGVPFAQCFFACELDEWNLMKRKKRKISWLNGSCFKQKSGI